jgi:general secretion pathway protein F
MTSYFYKAVASDGKLRTGTLSADSDRWVALELRKQGLTPVYVGLQQQKKSIELKLPQFKGKKRRDVLFFTQELSTLLNASVPLDRALSITAELTERANFRAIVVDVLRVLKGGRTLADSLGTHPEYFSDLFTNMVRAGEASGSLATVFERLSEFERTKDDLRNYIISSMIYPVLLAAVGCASIFILLNWVVPRFAQVFQNSHIEMPVPTKVMLAASDLMHKYALPVIGAIVAFIVSMYLYIRTVKGRLWWDTLRLKLPLLGDALRKAETARFARAMGTLVQSSVPLVQSIGIAGGILNNKRISGSLDSIAQGVKRGEGIAGPLRKAGQFPPLAGHLLAVGEETGRLDHMFNRMAEIYEVDTKAAIRRFMSLFEPLVILVMGIVVGALILSMLIAITSINDVAL